MTRNRSRLLSWTIVAIAASFAACDSHGTTLRLIGTAGVTSPTPFVDARLSPSALPLTFVSGFGCPLVQPFATRFDLIVDGRGADVFLNQLAFEFEFDGSAGPVPPLILSTTDLRGRFGDTTVRAGFSRTFAFQQPFGCGLGRPPRGLRLRGTVLTFGGAVQEFLVRGALR